MEFKVRLHPNASKIKAVVTERGLELYVHAPPEKGKANKELIRRLSKALGVPKSALEIIKGETSREKTVRIDNQTFQDSQKDMISHVVQNYA